jgi:hypothetical protein
VRRPLREAWDTQAQDRYDSQPGEERYSAARCDRHPWSLWLVWQQSEILVHQRLEFDCKDRLHNAGPVEIQRAGYVRPVHGELLLIQIAFIKV